MKQNYKYVLAFICASSMLLSLPSVTPDKVLQEVTVSADEVSPSSGTCGKSLTWVLNADGVLTISGTGQMEDWTMSSMPWASNRDNIKSVIIEEGVTDIGAYAFYMCVNLEHISIPNTVTYIDKYTFYGCKSLSEIQIPEKVSNIGDYAFYSCSGLKSLEFPKNMSSISMCICSQCTGLISVKLPKKITSGTIYNGAFTNCTSLTDITLPDTLTFIGEAAFQSCRSLKSLTIPENVKTINKSAFSQCVGLESIDLPDRITSISVNAFSNCTSLKEFTIPDNVSEIGEGSFYNCTALETMHMNEKPITFGMGILNGCTNFISFDVSESNPTYSSSEGVLYNKDQSILYLYGDNKTPKFTYNIPSSVTSIGDYAFYGNKTIYSISIPESVTNIGIKAFMGSSNLTQVTIPDSIKQIRQYAFSNTPWLNNQKQSNPMVIVNGILIDGTACSGEVSIPDGVTMIGENAFAGCANLTSVSIPDSVTKIHNYAFNNCYKLENIDIPESATSIGSFVFTNTPWLKARQEADPLVIVNKMLVDGSKCSGSVVIPEGTKAICGYAFMNNSSLQSIVLPESMTHILVGAFYRCQKLTDVKVTENLEYIGDYAFMDCTSLGNLIIPDSVVHVGTAAFQSSGYAYAMHLTIYGLPNSYIEQYVNENGLRNHFKKLVPGLTWDLADDGTLTIGGTGVTIPSDSNAPWSNVAKSVKNIVIQEGVVGIDSDAFGYLYSNLESVYISDSITNIGNHVFERCDGIKEITVSSNNKKYFSSDGALYLQSYDGCFRISSSDL